MRARVFSSLLVSTILTSALGAQGVIVQSTSDTKFFGALGTMAGIAARMGGGNMHDMKSTTSIAGHKMKVESENTATIIDADEGRFTSIDHKQKTYTSITFAEMAAAIQQAGQSSKQQIQQAKAEAAKDPSKPKGDVNIKYNASVERPGQREKVAGYNAERVFITVTIEAEATPEGEKTQQVGTMVFLMDEWMSKDAPQIAATQDFQRAYAQKVGQTFRPAMEGLQTAFAADPRMKGGFEAAAKELAKVPGISLKSVTYVALVPPDKQFDRGLVLGDAAAADAAKKDEKPKSGGFRGLMGAIKDAANKQQQSSSNDKGAQEVKQATMLSINHEVSSITVGAVPSGTFDVPAGYREVKRTMP
jgi:hypothetical protein